MPKRNRKPKTRRYRARKWLKRRMPSTIPMEEIVALGATPFVPCSPGWATPYDALIRDQDFGHVMKSYLGGFTGIYVLADGSIKFDAFKTLNPFDFNYAPYLKMMGYAYLASKIRKRVAKGSSKFFHKIPLIGRFIS